MRPRADIAAICPPFQRRSELGIVLGLGFGGGDSKVEGDLVGNFPSSV